MKPLNWLDMFTLMMMTLYVYTCIFYFKMNILKMNKKMNNNIYQTYIKYNKKW